MIFAWSSIYFPVRLPCFQELLSESGHQKAIFYFILPSVDPKNKFRERGSTSQEPGYQRFDSF